MERIEIKIGGDFSVYYFDIGIIVYGIFYLNSFLDYRIKSCKLESVSKIMKNNLRMGKKNYKERLNLLIENWFI